MYHKSSKLSWDHIKPRAKVVQQKSLKGKKKLIQAQNENQAARKSKAGSRKYQGTTEAAHGRPHSRQEEELESRKGGREGREGAQRRRQRRRRRGRRRRRAEQPRRRRTRTRRKRERDRDRARSTTFHHFYSLTILTFHVSPFSQKN